MLWRRAFGTCRSGLCCRCRLSSCFKSPKTDCRYYIKQERTSTLFLLRVSFLQILKISFWCLLLVPGSSHSGPHCPVQPLHPRIDAHFIGLDPLLLWLRRQGEGEETRGTPGRLRRGAATASSLSPDANCPAAAYTASWVASPCSTQANHHGTARDW